MKRLLFLLLLAHGFAHGQALRDINYKYQYDLGEAFTFRMEAERLPENWNVFYRLQLKDSTGVVSDYTIQWDLRGSLAEKEGNVITEDASAKGAARGGLTGKLTPPATSNVQLLVAKITNAAQKRAWFFYKVLDPKYPVNGTLMKGNEIVFTPYTKTGAGYSIRAEFPTAIISHYRDDFPPAAPAFSESLGRVASLLKVDSIFTVPTQSSWNLSKEGLYLVQKDTSSADGFAFRVSDDYPRFAKVQNLADPLIYICTKQEFERVKQAKGDKRAFDKVILGITGDADRARSFMRSYFRRVELANEYFTSYKEGWKTDRGMIYVIFGLPDEVFKFSDREVWTYKNSSFKISFDFTKSPTLFDPENYVLIREKKFQETWYEVIDLWRNARF